MHAVGSKPQRNLSFEVENPLFFMIQGSVDIFHMILCQIWSLDLAEHVVSVKYLILSLHVM